MDTVRDGVADWSEAILTSCLATGYRVRICLATLWLRALAARLSGIRRQHDDHPSTG